MTPDERDQSKLVKLRERGEVVQIVNLHTRRIIHRSYFIEDAEQWCSVNGYTIMERP